MSAEQSPKPRITVVTLGVADMPRSISFYERLGFARKMKATGEEVAFFETGASVLALYPWEKLAADAAQPDQPRPTTFRGTTLAWNCGSSDEVNAVLAHAIRQGARLLKPAHKTDYGGYSGYFLDPDDHPWEVVVAPGLQVAADGRLQLPD
jgi:uncharacterized protein